MTIFELVKLALDELYEESKAQHTSKVDAEIKDQMDYLATSYRKLSSDERDPINYQDPATRFAYVFKYTASHGDYVVQTLQAARTALKGNLFKGEVLRLSCVGGGPGSDVIGVLKYLSDYPSEPTKKVTCYLLDGEQAWADTWTENRKFHRDFGFSEREFSTVGRDRPEQLECPEAVPPGRHLHAELLCVRSLRSRYGCRNRILEEDV